MWESELKDDAHYASMVVATIEGTKQYIQLTDKSLAGINPTDGKTLWRADFPGNTAVIPTPVVFGNLVYVTSGYGVGCRCFEVKKNAAKFEPKNCGTANKWSTTTEALFGSARMSMAIPIPKAGLARTSKPATVRWQDKSAWPERGAGKGSLAYADNRFVIRTEAKGTLALIAASPDGYKEHGRFEQPNRSRENAWAHPVISSGKLYIRDEDHLLCYDISARS